MWFRTLTLCRPVDLMPGLSAIFWVIGRTGMANICSKSPRASNTLTCIKLGSAHSEVVIWRSIAKLLLQAKPASERQPIVVLLGGPAGEHACYGGNCSVGEFRSEQHRRVGQADARTRLQPRPGSGPCTVRRTRPRSATKTHQPDPQRDRGRQRRTRCAETSGGCVTCLERYGNSAIFALNPDFYSQTDVTGFYHRRGVVRHDVRSANSFLAHQI